jgi:hypothetical protein
MGLLSTTRSFPLPEKPVDLSLVAQDVMAHFREQGYRVAGEERLGGGWHVSLAKGNVFASLAGLSTALKVDITRDPDAITAKTSIGIFGQQALPAAVSMLVYQPLVLAQVWGIVQQYRLDDEALRAVERSLATRGGAAPAAGPTATARGSTSDSGSSGGLWGSLGSLGNLGNLGNLWKGQSANAPRATVQEVRKRFCTACGAEIEADVKFCPACGTKADDPAE